MQIDILTSQFGQNRLAEKPVRACVGSCCVVGASGLAGWLAGWRLAGWLAAGWLDGWGGSIWGPFWRPILSVNHEVAH
jgi:hypothetical protein